MIKLSQSPYVHSRVEGIIRHYNMDSVITTSVYMSEIIRFL